MNAQQSEQEIQAKHLTAPRVTPKDVEEEISAEFYFTADDGICGRNTSKGGNYAPPYCIRHDDNEAAMAISLLTFCVLVLRNGFTVTGESACASRENFNEEIGRKIARQHAVDKIWPLLGFRLRDELAQSVLTEADAAADLAGVARPGA